MEELDNSQALLPDSFHARRSIEAYHLKSYFGVRNQRIRELIPSGLDPPRSLIQ